MMSARAPMHSTDDAEIFETKIMRVELRAVSEIQER